MPHREVLSKVSVSLFSVLLLGMSCRMNAALAQEQTLGFLINSNFEKGDRGWTLTSEKGVKGGRVVEEPDGNRALYAEGETYWMADVDFHVFVKIPREQFAGRQLKLSFRAKGDKDAYPGVVVICSTADKNEYLTTFWQSPYPELRTSLDEKYKTYEAIRDIPTAATAIIGLSLYNCTHRGRLWIDDVSISFAEPAQSQVARPQPSPMPAWDSVELTERELLEVGNTHNFLVTEWAYLYGIVSELERAVYYLSGSNPATQAAERQKRVTVLKDETEQLRQKLLALQSFYTNRFRARYADRYTPKRWWDFYWWNKGTGRDLLMSIGPEKSKKPPFLELEHAFASARGQCENLLADLRKQSASSRFADGAPSTRLRNLQSAIRNPDEKLFDDHFFPKRVLIGLRQGPYGWQATRWLNADFIFTHNLRTWDYDPQERRRITREPNGTEENHYNLRWVLTAWMDPQIRLPEQSPSFIKALAADPEMSAHTESGPLPLAPKASYHNVNLFHPTLRAYAERHYEELGRLYQDDKHVVLFEHVAEPCFFTHEGGGLSIFDYSDAAKVSFRSFLQNKFKTLKALNEAWRSSYIAFDQIQPPTSQKLRDMATEDLPLISEFRKFRKSAHIGFIKMAHDAYRKGGPRSAPVANRCARMYFNGNSADAYDTYRLAADTDLFCTHDCAEGSDKHRAELVYYHDIAEYLNKPRASMEFYPFNPDGNNFDPKKQDSMALFHRGINSLWQLLAWDVTTICPWIENSTGGRGGVGLWSPTLESAMTLVHESAGIVPLVKKQVEEGLGEVVLNSKIVKPAIAMLAPYDSGIVGWPDGQTMDEGVAIHRFLEEKNYDYRCIPEELILNGQESLTDVKVLFTPYVLWASEPLQKKLLDWVSRGGILVSVGPFGFWDEYGRMSRSLLNKAFGNMPIEVTRSGVYTFSFPYEPLSRQKGVTVETLVPYTEKKQPNLIRADCGRGKIFLTADTSMDQVLSESKQVILRAVDEAIGVRNAWCANQLFDLVTRQRKDSNERYLIVLNRSTEKTCEDTIVVKGKYRNLRDLSIGGGFPIPSKASAGVTVFKTRLGPGEGTCIALGVYHSVEAPKAQREAFIKAETSGAETEIQETLAKINPKTNSVSFAKAMTCRNVALLLQTQGKSTEALEFARRAVRFTETKTGLPEKGAMFASLRAQVPPSIDGNDGEWDNVRWTPMGTAQFKSLWDESFLYFLIEVKDADIQNDFHPPNLYNGDCVEIYLDVLGQGGDRKHGRLDYQFVVAPDGQVQVVEKDRLTRTYAFGKRTSGGYRILVAIAHDDTLLAPTAGYVLAFNLRQLDFGIKDGQRSSLGDQMLARTGYHPAFNTNGWPKLQLQDINVGATPAKAQFAASANTIEVSGRGNTLKSIAEQIGRDAILRVTEGSTILGASLHLMEGSELMLGDGIVTRSDSLKRCVLSAEKGSRIQLIGNPVLLNIDAAEGLKACRLNSATRNRLVVKKRVAIVLTDKQSRPVKDTAIGVKVTDSETRELLSDTSERPDENGMIRIELPAAVIDVELERATFRQKRYDLVINDVAVTATYPMTGIKPLGQDEYKLTCHINR